MSWTRGTILTLALAASVVGFTEAADASSVPPLCSTTNLRVVEEDGGGAAGTRILTISFQNAGRQVCRVGGFPGVTLYARGHRELTVAKRSRPARISQLTLKPRQRADADVTYGEQPHPETQRCRVPTTLRIYPPDNRKALSVPLRDSGAYCGDAQVYPLAATGQKSLNS